MAKIRVGQLAKELNIKVAEAIDLLSKIGVEVKTNLSTVDDEAAARLRSSLPRTTEPAAAKGSAALQADHPHAGGTVSARAPRPTVAAAAAKPTAKSASRPGASPTTPAATAAGKSATPLRPQSPAAIKPGIAGAVPARPGLPGASSPVKAASPTAVAMIRPVAPGLKPPSLPLNRPVTGATAVRPAGSRLGVSAPRTGIAGAPPVRPLGGAGSTPGLRPAAPANRAPLGGSGLAGRPAQVGTSGTARPSPAPRPATPAQGPRFVPQAPPATKRPALASSAPAAVRPARPEPAMPPPHPVTPSPPPVPEVLKEITITEGVTVKELSEKLERKAKDIITRLISRGILATINQPLDVKLAQEICREFGFDAKVISFEEEFTLEEAGEAVPANQRTRYPVVTIMGHVDHGKTSLLDAIRESNIVGGEAGGITQHIGAYHTRHKNRGITFIDTPGHEAFTMMRARGARVTDIVVLVVAADDGVMPQTTEAIDHARAAGVPLVVAINKIDKPGANLDRVKKQLSDHGLLVEDWGGQIVAVPISAKQKTGITELLEMILLVADIGDLKADPTSLASGTVLESRLDRSRGPVATALVQRGTLKIGDPFIAGAIHGKVRAMFDDLGRRVREAGPSIPVEILGLEGVPRAGDPFQVLEEEWKVRQIGAFRQQKLRQEALAKSSRLTLDHLYLQIKEGMVKELPLVVKADVQGSIEALAKTLNDLPSDKVKIKIIHSGTGAVTESDVLLASASNAIIIGFNVRPERSAQDLADKEKVDVRLHSIIYDVANEIRNAMVGLLEPESKEMYLGRAEVRQVFKVPKIGSVAGCMVSDGRITRTAEIRLLRDNVVAHTGRVASLRRFKDDASEVKAGYECGIGLANFNDVKTGDVIEAFKIEKIAVKSL